MGCEGSFIDVPIDGFNRRELCWIEAGQPDYGAVIVPHAQIGNRVFKFVAVRVRVILILTSSSYLAAAVKA